MYNKHLSETIASVSNIPCYDEVKNSIDIFCNHNRVVFCTMGKSAFACRKVVHTAISYGLSWYNLDVCHAFHGDAGIIKEDDLLVFVSKSGETKETVEVAEYFKDWETIAMTSNQNSSLSKLCKTNIIIPIVTESSPFGYAPMISTSSYMICLHGILCEVIVANKCTINEYERNHPGGSIGKRILHSKRGS
jgi:arabinose-5-phosphate isomerase